MLRAAQLAALFVVCWVVALSAAPAEKRVYKVDSVIAIVKGRTLTIQVKGAVESGGWKKARLRPLRGAPSEAHTTVVEFLATPPPPTMTVIEALVPVQASMRIRARPHTVSVRVEAEANEVTSQVLH